MSSMRFLPVLVLLAACSSGAPTVYGQMAPGMSPPPPRAPVFNPTLDAPITTGQLGFIGPPANIPRGESKRVLPPTKEPGLWSADRPRASMKIPDAFREFKMLGIPIVYPDEAETILDAWPTRICGGMTQLVFDATGMEDALLRTLSEKERACLVAKLMEDCAKFVKGEKKNATGSDAKTYAQMLDGAEKNRAKSCSDGADSKAVKRWFNMLKDRWTLPEELGGSR